MIDWPTWLRDWRGIVSRIPEGTFEYIHHIYNSKNFKILMVSNYNPLLDGEKIYVSMPTSSFEAQVANFSRRTAEVGLARVITTKGAPRFILEQGPEALEWLAFLEGMDVGRLSNAMRSGSLWRDVAEHLMYSETAKVVDTIRRAQLDVLKERIDEYESLSRKTKEELYDAAANIKKSVRRRIA